MVTKIFIYLIVAATTLLFMSPALAQNNQACRWIYSRDNNSDSCQLTLGNSTNKWETGLKCSASTKGKYNNTCCCPVRALSKIAPKYIIIGSLIIVFGLITGYSLIIKKSE